MFSFTSWQFFLVHAGCFHHGFGFDLLSSAVLVFFLLCILSVFTTTWLFQILCFSVFFLLDFENSLGIFVFHVLLFLSLLHKFFRLVFTSCWVSEHPVWSATSSKVLCRQSCFFSSTNAFTLHELKVPYHQPIWTYEWLGMG